jgi:hypothetical protein
VIHIAVASVNCSGVRRMFRIGESLLLFISLSVFAAGQERPAAPEDHHKLVQLEAIQVTGTRLPPNSIIRISGLKVGQMINDDVLKQASDKITSTGLVKGIDYGYNIAPGKPGVSLNLKVFDEGPLLPAHILPEQDSQPIWACLQAADPIFTREMPNTENALHFYSINIARCIGSPPSGKDGIAATIACDGSGKSIAINFHLPVFRGR